MPKPFDIGDWIYSPSVEGTVEDISFRSTRIRTFANSLVTVPNSYLETPVEHYPTKKSGEGESVSV